MFRGLLVVDDSAAVRYGLKLVFQKSNLDVVAEATTCAEALDCLRQKTIDLVLLDIKLPDGNGLDLLPQIKAINPDLPVLMHTLSDTSTDVVHSYQRGASGYVVKGHDPRELIRLIQRLCDGENAWTTAQLEYVEQHKSLNS